MSNQLSTNADNVDNANLLVVFCTYDPPMRPTDDLRVRRERTECDGTPFDSGFTYSAFLEGEYLEKLSEVSSPKREAPQVRKAN